MNEVYEWDLVLYGCLIDCQYTMLNKEECCRINTLNRTDRVMVVSDNFDHIFKEMQTFSFKFTEMSEFSYD